MAVADSILIPGKDGFARIDPKAKESKLGEAVGGLKQPCGGVVNAFSSLWVANCGDGTLARLDPRTFKVTKTLATGAGNMRSGIAATTDSVWMFTDSRGTISRIDPVQKRSRRGVPRLPGLQHARIRRDGTLADVPRGGPGVANRPANQPGGQVN